MTDLRQNKIAIVMSGGGMRSSFGAGAIVALAIELGFKNPNILICGSGSAGTGAYYIAGQYNSLRKLWCELLTSKRFLNRIRFWKMLDIDYLVDEIMKKKEKLNTNKIVSSDVNYIVPIMNRDTGIIEYLSNHDKVDLFECLRATKAMPLFYKLNPKIKIKGNIYCDSKVSASADLNINKAIKLGARKILVIDTSSKRTFLSNKAVNAFFRLFVLSRGSWQHYSKLQKSLEDFTIPAGVNVYRIEPNKKLKISATCNKQRLLEEAFNQGYNQVKEDQNLRKFLYDAKR